MEIPFYSQGTSTLFYDDGVYSNTRFQDHINSTTDSATNSSFELGVGRIIPASILSMIGIVSIIGNISLWLIIFRDKTLKSASNALLLCLSSADLLVSTVNLPITVTTLLATKWIFSEATCIWSGILVMASVLVSIMSLGVISVNRYVLICHPDRYGQIYTARNTGFMIAGEYSTQRKIKLGEM